MSTFLAFVFAVGGMTNIMLLANFPLVKWVREKALNSGSEKLAELFTCPMCMGWWCGLVMALLLYPAGWMTFPLACAGSFVGRQTAFVETWIEANSLVDVGGGNG